MGVAPATAAALHPSRAKLSEPHHGPHLPALPMRRPIQRTQLCPNPAIPSRPPTATLIPSRPPPPSSYAPPQPAAASYVPSPIMPPRCARPVLASGNPRHNLATPAPRRAGRQLRPPPPASFNRPPQPPRFWQRASPLVVARPARRGGVTVLTSRRCASSSPRARHAWPPSRQRVVGRIRKHDSLDRRHGPSRGTTGPPGVAGYGRHGHAAPHASSTAACCSAAITAPAPVASLSVLLTAARPPRRSGPRQTRRRRTTPHRSSIRAVQLGAAPLSGCHWARRSSLQRMVESRRTSSQLTYRLEEADVTAIARLRRPREGRLRGQGGRQSGPSFRSSPRAAVAALKVHPKTERGLDTAFQHGDLSRSEHLGIAVEHRGPAVSCAGYQERRCPEHRRSRTQDRRSCCADQAVTGVAPDDLSRRHVHADYTGSPRRAVRHADHQTSSCRQSLGTGTWSSGAVVVRRSASSEVSTVRSMVYLALNLRPPPCRTGADACPLPGDDEGAPGRMPPFETELVPLPGPDLGRPCPFLTVRQPYRIS